MYSFRYLCIWRLTKYVHIYRKSAAISLNAHSLPLSPSLLVHSILNNSSEWELLTYNCLNCPVQTQIQTKTHTNTQMHTASHAGLQVVPEENPLLVDNWFPTFTILLPPTPVLFSLTVWQS